MPKVPSDIEQWNSACLAKYIRKHWCPKGLFKAAMEVMSKGSRYMSVSILCDYYCHQEAHPDTPPEIISELKRRASLPP